jgi:hypothetical protein
MKATVTIIRHFYKEITLNIEQEHIEGLTAEEIGDKLVNEQIPFDEDLVDTQELESLEITHQDWVRTSRFDVYNEDGGHSYGGHL